MRASRVLALPLLAGAALVVASCASDGGGGGGGGDVSWEDSPLSAYLTSDEDRAAMENPEQANAQWAEENREIEDLVAACMAEEGFEYVPNVQDAGSTGSYEYDPDDPEWVAQYGYGAINYPGRDEQMTASEEYVDPNADTYDALSDSERVAWDETLWGPMPTEEEIEAANGEIEYDRENAGCYGDAQNEVWGNDEDNPWNQEEFEPLFERMSSLYDQGTNDPRYAEIDAEWSTCLAESGQGDFGSPAEAQNSIYEAQNQLWSEQSDPETGMLPDGVEDELAAQEIALATADLECRTQTDYMSRTLEIQFELEEQFIEDNRAELEALKAALEQAS